MNDNDDRNGEDRVPDAYLDLLRTLTHKVRTPLSTIIGFADMMEHEMLGTLGNPSYRDYAVDIHKAARNILEALDDLAEPARFHRFAESRNDFRHLIELAPDFIGICRDGNIEMVNPAGAGMLGRWSSDELNGRPIFDFIHPDDRELMRPDLSDLCDEKLRMPIRLVRGDDIVVEVEISAVPYTDPDASGRERGDAVMVFARDVSERNRARTAAIQREGNLRTVMDSVADGILTMDETGKIETVNAAIERMFRTEATSLAGKHIEVLLPDMAGIGPQTFIERSRDEVNRFGLDQDKELTGRRKNGQVFPVEAIVSESLAGGKRLYICAIHDITSRKNFEDRLRTLATRDPLTGLANRNLFADRLGDAMDRVDAGDGRIAIMYVDLDQFQNINDAFGHEVGDEVIKLASLRLQGCVKDKDTIARVGGDEFHIMLPDVTDDDDIERLARDVLVALSSPYTIDRREIFSSASVGVGIYPGHGEDMSALMRNVDTAANNAKRDGRATYKFYTPSMSEEVHRRVDIGHQLRRALENDELSLHYQAKVDLDSQRVIGAEALLRWHSEALGFVSPAEFVPIAEETGLIVPIGEWVLETACREAAAWHAVDGAPIQVAVNLSALQFSHGDLVERVRKSLDRSSLAPANLDLELTESLLVERPEETIAVLNNLKEMGISISMDDFGTGYSSLSYLTRFPLDSIKVDRAFVTELPDNHDSVVVVRAIVGMSKELDLHIVAEGVETAEQMEFLHGLGCHTGQGYYFSKPIPNDDFIDYLRADAAE